DDVPIVLPDEEAFAVERRAGKLQRPTAFGGNGAGARRWIRFVDFVDGQLVFPTVVVPNVAKIQMSRVVDRDVLPVVEPGTDDREHRACLALAVNGVEDLLLRSTAVVVCPEHVGIPAA